jgi:hypothetical protein
MAVTYERRMLILALLAATLPVPARASAVPVHDLYLNIDQPVYTNLPVWIKADLSYPYEARYPYHENPSDFGPNQLEVKRGGQVLLPRPFPNFGGFVGTGIMNGSAAPASAPTNRLPLHLQYSIDEPGTYSVRWTAIRHHLVSGHWAPEVVARSDWLTFEVKPSTPGQREAWLKKQLAAVPADPGQLVGDFLPSLLVASPDPRVLQIFLDQLYSKDSLVSGYALSSLGLFSADDLRTQVLELVHHRGLSGRMAYLISWNPQFREYREDLVRTILPFLRSGDDRQVAATLNLLGSLVHSERFSWPANSDVPAQVDRAVLAVASHLVKRGGEVPQTLAIYLGGIKSHVARGLLWQLAERTEPEHEQALIALTWIGDERDLPRLGDLLLKSGDSDVYGSDRASLPYSLMRGYGDRAIPYLEQAVSKSPYAFVRTQSAEELALKGRPVAFSFFLDAVENNRFYKQELVTWLKDRFPNELSGSADDEAVIAFLNSRLRP